MSDVLPPQPEASTSSAVAQASPCSICAANPAVYTCPRCSMRTCSLPCSTTHKSMGDGCSGIRNKAAYVPMNQYGYMALMDDYVFLEDMGRKVSDWGREIVRGGYMGGAAGGMNRGRGAMSMRGRGRGRGTGPVGKTRTRRDILKMQLDFRDIEMDMLPNGMERRTLNQSTWDFKNKTALLTVEFVFHPPKDPLAPSSAPPEAPFTLVTHRNALETPLLSIMRTRVTERSNSKKEKPIPSWLIPLISPDPDVPESFTPPTCVMRTPLDPLSSLSHSGGPRPGQLLCAGYYRLDSALPLGAILKHKNFVEFPTIEVWEDGAFHGTIVDDQGAVLHGDEEHRPKRRKLNVREGKKAITGLLGGYGSEDEDEGDVEERNVLDLLGGYAGSEDEQTEETNREEPSDEDAEGETDEEYEGDPEQLAALLEKLRQAGALRDPNADGALASLGDPDDEQVDWGDSADEGPVEDS
ncbi:hypothetical protein OBBRIDRAFT_772500 [Obba rivulosa]|uniref:HIT-type domain-containing protein n=1 Tax=Obba rivulosa TaxID=1052685 RepID=A0A8E2DNF9_9APHY|nr:hypothetical protein OBBRIDRAFT_772500 [Obba rivulosa]